MIHNAKINSEKSSLRTVLQDLQIGNTYSGKIKTIMPYGAFVEVSPGVEGILDLKAVKETVKGILKEGHIIEVKLVGIINKTLELTLKNNH